MTTKTEWLLSNQRTVRAQPVKNETILFLTFFHVKMCCNSFSGGNKRRSNREKKAEQNKTWYTIRRLHGVFVICIQMVLSSNNPLKYRPAVQLSISLEFLLSHNRIRFLLSPALALCKTQFHNEEVILMKCSCSLNEMTSKSHVLHPEIGMETRIGTINSTPAKHTFVSFLILTIALRIVY